MRKGWRYVVMVLVWALLTAGCASTSGSVTGRLVLPAKTLKAGATMTGQVIVTNDSGHAIQVAGCKAIFAVALDGAGVQQEPAWADCYQSFTIPVGQSRWKVPVYAAYDYCDSEHPSKQTPACQTGGNVMPTLPKGRYQAKVVQIKHVFATPAAVPVTVT